MNRDFFARFFILIFTLFYGLSGQSGGRGYTPGLSETDPELLLYTDPVILPQATPIKLEHIMELRTNIDAKRAACGIGSTSWTDSPLIRGRTPIKKIHIDELRTSATELSRASATYNHLTYVPPEFTDHEIRAGSTPIKAQHISELRTLVARSVCGTPSGPSMSCQDVCGNTVPNGDFRNIMFVSRSCTGHFQNETYRCVSGTWRYESGSGTRIMSCDDPC